MKLVNPAPQPGPSEISVKGISRLSPEAQAEILAAEPDATNSITEPVKVVPVRAKATNVKPSFSYTVPGNGIAVLKLAR